ncbi:MAG: DUF47 family protein [Bryobacterales bacterium]|nr:DUF47 family protein [Bryobacterales bacterium]
MCALRFIPREEKFFEYFGDQAQILRQSAKLLTDGLLADRKTMARNAEAISDLEKRGDQLYRDVYDKLRKTFITPFDPEDIHFLASKLEDAIDGTEEAARRIVAYLPTHTSPGMTSLCGLLLKVTDQLEKALMALKVGGDVQPHCEAIRELEEESDQAMQAGLIDLFTREKDPIEVIKAKDLIELLESIIDLCDDAGDILANVVVKNS